MKKFAWADKKHSEYLEKGVTRHLHRKRFAVIMSEVERMSCDARGALDCLDIGCGDGIYLKSLYGIGNLRWTGCDADYARLVRAKERCREDAYFINSLAEDAPFKSGMFDVALLHHVIEHVQDDRRLLRECRRILKTNGILIVGVPNENSVNGKLSRFLHPGLYRRGEHLHFYNERDITRLLDLSGFEILSVKRVGFLFPIYYLHMLMISSKALFELGHIITKIFKSNADSLIIIAKKKDLS